MLKSTFGIIDYLIFALTLGSSFAIGIYFGCFGSKQKSATEYLYGKGSMNAIPIGLSIYSSAISAITLIGAPTEVYSFGSQYFLVYGGTLLSLIITWIFILPVFCGDLKLKTPYEYFELRYNYKIRVLSTTIYTLHTLIYMPVVLYATTVNFSEVTGILLPICTTVIGGVCVFYTMLGGFSAVIWSDTLQATLMMTSCIFVLIKGIINVGGLNVLWYRADEGQRLNFFNMDLNPFIRLSFWSSIIGMSFNHAAHSGCSASAIQRYMALKNEKQGRMSSLIGVVCAFFIGLIACSIGLTMYAEYYNCDPVKNQEINSYNKLFAYYVAKTVENIPGFLGYFIAGLLSAGLSTLSAELNTVSGLIYHCFIKKFYSKSIGEAKGAVIMKLLVFFIGCFYLIIAPLLEKAKFILSFAMALTGITYGAKIGILILGTSFPKSNATGTFYGAISSILIMTWINIGALYSDINSKYALPFSTENCFNNTIQIENSTLQDPISRMSDDEPFIIYKLSFMYYAALGTVITVLVGLIVSWITGGNDVNTIDPYLLIPKVRPKIQIANDEENLKVLSNS